MRGRYPADRFCLHGKRGVVCSDSEQRHHCFQRGAVRHHAGHRPCHRPVQGHAYRGHRRTHDPSRQENHPKAFRRILGNRPVHAHRLLAHLALSRSGAHRRPSSARCRTRRPSRHLGCRSDEHLRARHGAFFRFLHSGRAGHHSGEHGASGDLRHLRLRSALAGHVHHGCRRFLFHDETGNEEEPFKKRTGNHCRLRGL